MNSNKFRFWKSSSFFILKGLFIGALIGGAVGAYLNSEKGGVTRKWIKKNAKVLVDEVKKRAKELYTKELLDKIEKEVKNAMKELNKVNTTK